MKILFDQMNDTVLEHFNGGEGEFVAKRFHDGKCKILRGLLQPGCSGESSTASRVCSVVKSSIRQKVSFGSMPSAVINSFATMLYTGIS